MTLRSCIVSIAISTLVSCQSAKSHPDSGMEGGTPYDAGDGSSSDAGGPDASASDAGDVDAGSLDAGSLDAGDGGTGPRSFTLTFPAWTLLTNQERAKCVVLDLANETPVSIGSIQVQSAATTYSFELYEDGSDAEAPAPVDCEPLSSLARAGLSPLVFSNRPDDLVTLPEGVAFSFDAHQKLLLVLHARNLGLADVTVDASISFTERLDVDHHAGLVLFASPDVHVGAGQSGSLDVFTPIDPALADSTQFFAIAGYQNDLGTGVSVATGAAGGPDVSLYSVSDVRGAVDWRQSLTPFSVPTGQGFHFVCTWDNTAGQAAVGYGSSAYDELCVFGAYYFEPTTLNACGHTSQLGGVDLCCPGPALCDNLF